MLAINKPFSLKCDEYITKCEKINIVVMQIRRLSHFKYEKLLVAATERVYLNKFCKGCLQHLSYKVIVNMKMHHHLVLLITTNNSVILDPIQKIHFYLFTSQIKGGVDSGLVVSAHTQCFNLYVQTAEVHDYTTCSLFFHQIYLVQLRLGFTSLFY